MTTPPSFAWKLRIMRTLRGISAQSLADAVSLSQSQISRLDLGAAEPSPAVEAAIRDALAWTPAVDLVLENLAASAAVDEHQSLIDAGQGVLL